MPSNEIPRDRREAALERVETWVAESDCPGASVAVTDGDSIVATQGFGDRTLDPVAPATPDTLYAVGSVAKPVTALATLVLDERGRIDVHDPVTEYLSCFEGAPGDPITVHQLLSHTSGMPSDDLAFRASELDDWADFLAFLEGTVDRRRVDEPRWIYYNSGYTVLARIIEVVSGTDFPSFVERELFDPLAMGRSTFDGGALETAANAMTPYALADGNLQAVPPSENSAFASQILNGPGGLVTTVVDLARFLQASVGDDPHLADVPLERTYEPVSTRRRFVDGTEYSYGYGWEVSPFGSDTLVCHGGNTGVSAGFVGFLADRGIGIAIGCNAVADPGSVAREALAVLSGRDPLSVDPVHSIERTVESLTGRYESYTGAHHATVTRRDARLEVEFGGDVGQFEVPGIPTDLTTDTYRFTSPEAIESTTDLEFFVGRDEPEFLFEGQLFHRVESDPETGQPDAS